MRQRFLALLLSVSFYAVCAEPLQAQMASSSLAPYQQAQRTVAKQCQPTVLGALLSIGWTYATKSRYQPRPCPDNSQEERKDTLAQEAKPEPPPGRLADLPATEALRQARLLFIRSRSSWFNPEKLERELLKRKEFGEFGLEITRRASRAELILEITRKTFTTRFTCSIIEPTTERILAGTTASSLGGEIEPHLADAIIKEFKAARSKPATEEKKPD